MRGQTDGTLLDRLQQRVVAGWRNRINDPSKPRPSHVQEKAVENLLLDAIDFAYEQKRLAEKLTARVAVLVEENDRMLRKIDGLTIHQLVGKK